MIARYHSFNNTGKYLFFSELIILFCQIISVIFSIIYYIIKYDFFELTIANIISFVLFLIPFIIDICTNYNFTGKNSLKIIPNIICIFFSGIFLLYVFISGIGFCMGGCKKEHPLNVLHGITLLLMAFFAFNYLITGIKDFLISIYENKNTNNEHFIEGNYNVIVTTNDMNGYTIGSNITQN